MRNLLLLGLCLIALSANAQLTEADTFAFIQLKLYEPNGSPYAKSKVTLKGKKSGHEVTVTTNAKGMVKAKVPISDEYTVHCGNNQCLRSVRVGDFPYVTSNFQGYTRRFIYYKFKCSDLQGQPLVSEEVKVQSVETGEIYVDSTNKKGIAEFYLPYEYDFLVSLTYYPNISRLRPNDNGKEYKMMSSAFAWVGTEEKNRRARIADSIAKAREAEVLALIDSLEKLGTSPEEIAELDVSIPITEDTEWVGKCIRRKAKIYEKLLENDPKIFEKLEKPILAPLYRLRNTWKNAVIVTDMTGSMSPYREQVLIWHAMTMSEDHQHKYVFFTDENDGGCTKTPPIGKGEGLYLFQGNMSEFDPLIKVMRKAVERTYPNSSTPENDLEAALAGKRIMDKADALILIVDNYSPVRDIALLEKFDVPVHVITCGSAFFKDWNLISEEYLNIAYKTGGSVHTIEDDLVDLAKRQEGETFKIQGTSFVIKNGQIIQQEKL